MFSIPYVIFRPYNVYGPRQNIGDPYRNVVGIFMNQCMKGEPMRIFGDGSQVRAFSYIDDVAPTIASIVDSPQHWNQTYNIGGSVPITVNNLAGEVARAMGVEPNTVHAEARKEVHTAFCDNTKAHALRPASKPYTGITEGIEKMAVWARQHGAREGKKFTNIEIRDKLPPSWM